MSTKTKMVLPKINVFKIADKFSHMANNFKFPFHMKMAYSSFITKTALNIKTFRRKKNDIYNILAQNIDCGYTIRIASTNLESTHNLCFVSKTKKILPVNFYGQNTIRLN